MALSGAHPSAEAQHFLFVLTQKYQLPQSTWFFLQDPFIVPWEINKNVTEKPHPSILKQVRKEIHDSVP